MNELAFHSGNLIVNKREYRFDLQFSPKKHPDAINGGHIVYLQVFDPNEILVLWYDEEWKLAPNHDAAKNEILKLILLEFEEDSE